MDALTDHRGIISTLVFNPRGALREMLGIMVWLSPPENNEEVTSSLGLTATRSSKVDSG
ncbi:hypothetical protein [Streptococcus sp. 121]|uniref:hypothetical protein n=1 Tax=Streptococcus sp. 121 TaxID=2797637 RepID=UPI003FA36552